MNDQSSLRLSALRAFLGKVHPSARLVKASFNEDRLIRITCLTRGEPDASACDAFSCAGSEIVADFPDCDIMEDIRAHDGPLPRENLITEGWIFQEFEADLYSDAETGA